MKKCPKCGGLYDDMDTKCSNCKCYLSYEDDLSQNKKNLSCSCPHCGSTNIQLLRKKWSPLTGFLTNKVEKYCVNCGKKIK